MFLSTATDLSCRRNGTVNRRLFSFFDSLTPPNSSPINHVRTTDITVDATRNLWFRMFIPTNTSSYSNMPVLVFFHGGGFAIMSAASSAYDDLCRRFARELNAVIVSVNYRLAPEHKFPAPYVDGLDVLDFLDRNNNNNLVPDFNISELSLSNCFLMGDSAGGNIVHHVAKEYAKREKKWGRLKISGLIPLQAYFGGEERTESELRLDGIAPLVSMARTDWMWKAFLPDGADRDHEAANVFGPNGEELGDGFPSKALVVVGLWDPLQDWQRRYAEGLAARGKEVKVVEYDVIHAFYAFPEMKESGMLMEEIRSFIQN